MNKNHPFKNIASGVLFMAACVGADASAQQEYVDQVLMQLESAAYPLATAGYRGILGDGGALEDMTYEDYTVTLRAGSGYAVLGVCDTDCSDLDLSLFDGRGNLVVADETHDDAPLVEFSVTASGNFTLRVTMYECAAEPCYYGVGVYER